jgi:hypothetical protein
MRIQPVPPISHIVPDPLRRQAELLVERIRRSGITPQGQDLVAFEAAVAGNPQGIDLERLRDLLVRAGR